jgi:DMSO/TMAO reductase YedYZ molybdopterin-dependent catalytic subunit
MARFTRGFSGRGRTDDGRLPPGQYDTGRSWPVLNAEVTPKFDMTFAGVSVDTLLDAAGVQPAATHVVAFSHTGYTTNLPLADVTGGKAWVAWEVDGEPLPREHGGPARLLVPHLYFWKSAKWVAGLRLLDHDEPGFWERNGYHDRGDPWLEQRYQGD